MDENGSPDYFRIVFLLLLILALRCSCASSNWLYLAYSSVVAPSGPLSSDGEASRTDRSLSHFCDSLSGLNKYQKHVCFQQPNSMEYVRFGARNAIVECHYQFKFERWNCTTGRTPNDTAVDIFGATLRAANKESAFLSAITTAGMVHAVTKACSAGNLTYCGCDNTVAYREPLYREQLVMQADQPAVRNKNPEHTKPTEGKWSWGGCSDNVRYGVRFSKQFLDQAEKSGFQNTKNTKHLMNLHNQNVGREAVVRYMKKQCRCHGVSGSCEFQTCWQSMPKFTEVGTVVKAWYDRYHVQVARRSKKRLRRKEKSERKIPVRTNELVYIHNSPNYCVSNEELGILGTRGRECNRTSLKSDGCDLLCCGRGYNTRVEERTEMCLCKFVWCCHVKCKTCKTVVDVHTCK